MTDSVRLSRLELPEGKLDVVLDTDTFNEIDDQFALAYLLRSDDRLECRAIYAAPFESKGYSPSEGMEKSYEEIFNVLKLCKRQDKNSVVFKGSDRFLENENTPVISDAALDLIERSKSYGGDRPLYVIAIGAITNVASAILLDPTIIERIVVIWLGGNALHWHNTKEFNMEHDIAAARIVMGSGVPFVQLPCSGVVSEFSTSIPTLRHWIGGANELCDYLCDIVEQHEKEIWDGTVWHKTIWDVTAVAWLLNDNNRFMCDRVVHTHIPQYDHTYSVSNDTHLMRYVWYINRDPLFMDLFNKLKK